jgi:hypothetical protein
MSYSILKMIEFSLEYLLRNELREDVEIPEGHEAKAFIVSYVRRRISEIQKQTR